METAADKYIKSMLELKSSLAPDEVQSVSATEDTEKGILERIIWLVSSETSSAESSHKMINKIHKLEKDVLYWQDKVFNLNSINSAWTLNWIYKN